MRNYHPYVIVNGEETMFEAMDLDVAFDEAVRLKSDYGGSEAGIKVFTQGCFKIINWREGKHWRGAEAYLYRIVI